VAVKPVLVKLKQLDKPDMRLCHLPEGFFEFLLPRIVSHLRVDERVDVGVRLTAGQVRRVLSFVDADGDLRYLLNGYGDMLQSPLYLFDCHFAVPFFDFFAAFFFAFLSGSSVIGQRVS
jgi:hypothetical protein